MKKWSHTLFLLKIYARQPWPSNGMKMGCTGAPPLHQPPKGRSQFDPHGYPCRAGGGHSGGAPIIHSLCASAPGLRLISGRLFIPFPNSVK